MANKHEGRRLRRPKFSTVIALLALFAALGGSAYAAKEVINGKNIKKNSIKSKAVKNGTLKTKDLSAAAQSDLKGQQGPQGEQGPQGPQGPKGNTGAAGADGIVEPLFAEPASQNLADGVDTELGSLNVPAGEYLIQVRTNLFGGNNVDSISCSTVAGGETVDNFVWDPPAANTRVPTSMITVASLPAGEITVGCLSDGGTGSGSATKIIATPVA